MPVFLDTLAKNALGPMAHIESVRVAKLADLVADPDNARSHGEENLAAIEASLNRFGQVEPLVVQAGSGRIIGGNGRWVAMRALGWVSCNVVEVKIDDRSAAALSIALNRTSELATWDEAALARLLDGLKSEDELIGTGFDESEVDALLADLEAVPAPSDVCDPGPRGPPSRPTSRLGDLWILGDHRLLCGDSTDPRQVRRLLEGRMAVICATDPPYCVDYEGRRPHSKGKDWSKEYRESEIPDLGGFLTRFLKASLPSLAENAAIYVWHAHLRYPVIDRVLAEFGILRHQPIIWAKPGATFGYSVYRWAHEACVFGWRKGSQPPLYTREKLPTVWSVDWEGRARVSGDHPTQKPVRLFEIPLELHTRPGELVLEPFSGSGTQLIACERLGRKCRAIELSPHFTDVAVVRWQEATGRQAHLCGTTMTFADVAAERSNG